MRQKVLIIDEHPLMIEATSSIIKKMNVLLVGVAMTAEERMEYVKLHLPDLVILEWKLKKESGGDVVQKINEISPSSKILIFTSCDIYKDSPMMILPKVYGIVSKQAGSETFRNAVSCILDGYMVLPPESQSSPAPLVDVELTEDEATIMNLILRGITMDRIAETVHLSRRSIDNYQKRIYQKMGVAGKTQAIEMFMQTKYYRR